MKQEWITTTEAAARVGVTRQYILYLCTRGRVQGAHKVGNQWIIPAGAKIEPTGLGRPLRTLEIPRDPRRKR